MDSEARIVNCLRIAGEKITGINNKSEDELKDVIGLGLREALAKLHPAEKERSIEKMAEIYKDQYQKPDNIPYKLFEGVEPLLQDLKNTGFKLAIATGKGRQGLDQVLSTTGLSSHFDITRCASETKSKPHPLMLEEILDSLQMDAEQALMIGDTEYDMEMAVNAGMDRLAVSYGVHAEDRLMRFNPVGCIHDIKELPDALQTLFVR